MQEFLQRFCEWCRGDQIAKDKGLPPTGSIAMLTLCKRYLCLNFNIITHLFGRVWRRFFSVLRKPRIQEPWSRDNLYSPRELYIEPYNVRWLIVKGATLEWFGYPSKFDSRRLLWLIIFELQVAIWESLIQILIHCSVSCDFIWIIYMLPEKEKILSRYMHGQEGPLSNVLFELNMDIYTICIFCVFFSLWTSVDLFVDNVYCICRVTSFRKCLNSIWYVTASHRSDDSHSVTETWETLCTEPQSL